jgi:hypothetical protein
VTTRLARMLTGLVLFGIGFGYVEAAVVVYLRALDAPIREKHIQPPRDEVFPLLSLGQWKSGGGWHERIIATEIGREAATILMLAAVPLAYAVNWRQWMAGFLIGFGVWDIFYYVFLKVLIDWPASLLTWDILFLIPVPWVGPVIAPCLVAAWMVLLGALVLWREDRGRPAWVGWQHWFGGALSGLVIVVAFAWDCRNVIEGGFPNAFPWPIFAVGLALGVVVGLDTLRVRRVQLA